MRVYYFIGLTSLIMSCVVIIVGLTLPFIFSRESKHFINHEVNKKIHELFLSGESEEVYVFYDKFIKNKVVTIGIVNTAMIFDIPVNIFVSLARAEGGFKPDIISKKNKDGSYDIGLFQLNNKVYKDYEKDYLLNCVNNCRLAGQHLLVNYNKSGTWLNAVILFNSGSYKNINKKVIGHANKIMEYTEYLNIKFSERWK